MQGHEFWNAAGFVGTFANDYHDDLENDDEEEEEDSDENDVCWSGKVGGAGVDTKDDFNDDEPVLEICEPLDGGEARVVTHANQKAFEAAQRLDTRPP